MIDRPLRRACAVAVLALSAAACGGRGASPSSTTGASSAATGTPVAATTQAQQASCATAGLHTVDGGLLRVPSNAQPGRTPLLLVVIPGGDGDPSDRLGVGAPANRKGIAVLYPTSAGGGFWQLNEKFGTSDVTEVTQLIRRQAATGCFDQNRISITGVSNGAGFTARMGCELPNTFAAVIPVAAGYRALDPCPAAARASFLDIHGTADTVVPINGKKPDRKGNVARYTAGWARRDGCAATPRSSTPGRLVTRFAYTDCDDRTRVERVRLTGTQHGWPGSRFGPGGRPASANPSRFSATTEVLRFIATARRPGA
ncbi:MAG: polyhydroxybutyrate depolymerase [Solirubrobacteraceae bacterium]|nr:polyhydroxybutyrate depolymerase [Solirubrobacteraceae bacterium]